MRSTKRAGQQMERAIAPPRKQSSCFRCLVPLLLLILFACQANAGETVTILDGGQVYAGPISDRIPTNILAQSGLKLRPGDKVLFNGSPVSSDEALPPSRNYFLQVLRAASLVVNGKEYLMTAGPIAGALQATGTQLYSADQLEPPGESFISGGLSVRYSPAHVLSVMADGKQTQIRTSALTISSALAQAGIGLLGLDYSQPAEDRPLPQDGIIRVIRVSEAIILAQKSIPFTSQFQASPDVELDHQEILRPGQPGLTVSRSRIRYEDGKEVARLVESETVVRPPQNRLVAYGTKVVLHTASVDGVTLQYWRTVQMYATAYSPCNSGVKGQCFSGTSSALPAATGVVAVHPPLYSPFPR